MSRPKCGTRVPLQRVCCLACGCPVQPGDSARGKAAGEATRRKPLEPLVGPQPLKPLNDLYNSGALSQQLISAQERKRLIKAEVFLGGGIEKHKRRPKRPQDAFRLEEADIPEAYRNHIRCPPNRFELPKARGQEGEEESATAPPGAPPSSRGRRKSADDGAAAADGGPRSPSISIATTPRVIAESATLKAGQ